MSVVFWAIALVFAFIVGFVVAAPNYTRALLRRKR